MKEIRKEEWKKLYPIKKGIFLSIWLFGILLIYASAVAFVREHDFRALLLLVLIAAGVIKTYLPMKKYVMTSYHCMPYFHQIFTKKELEQLLEGEHFHLMKGSVGNEIKDVALKESENWLCIDGRFISKKLAIIGRAWVAASLNNRDTTSVKIFYMTGVQIQIKTGTSWQVEKIEKFNRSLWEVYQIIPAKIFKKDYERVSDILKNVCGKIEKENGMNEEKELVKFLLKTEENWKELFWEELPGFRMPEEKKESPVKNVSKKRM